MSTNYSYPPIGFLGLIMTDSLCDTTLLITHHLTSAIIRYIDFFDFYSRKNIQNHSYFFFIKVTRPWNESLFQERELKPLENGKILL